MNSDPSDSQVRQFYAEATLPEDRIDAIVSHGHSVAEARMWKRVAVAATLGLAGMILVCVTLAVRVTDDSRAVVDSGVQPDPGSRAEERAVAGPEAVAGTADGFRLIGVRTHGDGCPHCRAAGEVFAELRESFADEPIKFTFLDLRRKSETLEQSQTEFETLELSGLVEGRDAALVVLADPDGNLERLDASLGADRLARHIAGMMGEK